jgi:hypothetical protein
MTGGGTATWKVQGAAKQTRCCAVQQRPRPAIPPVLKAVDGSQGGRAGGAVRWRKLSARDGAFIVGVCKTERGGPPTRFGAEQTLVGIGGWHWCPESRRRGPSFALNSQ